MNKQGLKEMLILVDTLHGDIKRMCETKSLAELDTMAFYAKKNIEKLQAIRYKDFKM